MVTFEFRDLKGNISRLEIQAVAKLLNKPLNAFSDHLEGESFNEFANAQNVRKKGKWFLDRIAIGGKHFAVGTRR